MNSSQIKSWTGTLVIMLALSALLGLLAVTTRANAADNTPETKLEIQYSDGKLSMDVKNVEVKDVLTKIGELVPAKVDLGEGITEKVSLQVNSVDLKDGLAKLVIGEGTGIVIGYNEKGVVKLIKVSKVPAGAKDRIIAVRKVRDAYDASQVAERSLNLSQSKELVKDLLDESKRKQWGRLADKIQDIMIKEAKPYLKELMNHEKDYVRAEAATAFCNLVDIEDADFILDMAVSKDWDKRSTSARLAMPLVDDPRQIPILLEMLKEKDDAVRESVIMTVGSKKVIEAVPVLKEILESKDGGYIRFRAANALESITGKHYEWETPEDRKLQEEYKNEP